MGCMRAHDIKLRGLTWRNIYARHSGVTAVGADFYDCANFSFENITCTHLGGRPFAFWGAMGYSFAPTDTIRFINCDAIDCADSMGVQPGNTSDGFKVADYYGSYVYFYGCRAIRCSDDGFDVGGSGMLAIFDHCWAVANGRLQNGDGNGFKLSSGSEGGYPSPESPTPIKLLTHCLMAYNSTRGDGVACGMVAIEYSPYRRLNARVYNCTSYHNDIGFCEGYNDTYPFRTSVYKNNIAYASRLVQDLVRKNIAILDYVYPESHNTWDLYDPSPGSMPPWFVETDTVTVTNADFVLTDSTTAITQLTAPRKTDGSLPDITFMHLAEGSDLIDAGTNHLEDLAAIPSFEKRFIMPYPYSGTAPDIGFDEYAGEIIYITSIEVTGAGGSSVITIDNGTLQLSASILPVDATYQTVSWSITNGTGSATINSSGLVTAINDGIVTARATALDGSGIYDTYVITISNQTPPQTGTDIVTFTLSEQTGSATINPTTHTVSIEVEYGTDVTDLTPTITVSSGAIIDPLSGVSQNFTSPVVYTVTAEDLTEQAWTVTVTVAELPTGVRLLKQNGKLLKSGGKILIIQH
jgi:hypothetical protein